MKYFILDLSLAMLSKPLMTEVTTSSSSLMRPPWLVLKVRVWPTSAIEDTCEASTVEATSDPIRNTLVGLVAIAWGNINNTPLSSSRKYYRIGHKNIISNK